MNTKEQLIKYLEEKTKVLKTSKIKAAFEEIDRIDFVPMKYIDEAYKDYPLSIGFGQTISQPTTVAFMLELLKVEVNSKILDIGSGSGYTTALLAALAPEGEVLGIEIIPELAEMGKVNLAKYNLKNAKIEYGDSRKLEKNLKEFDRILVNAAADEIPESFAKILKPEGIMVIPIKHSVFKIIKKENRVQSMEYPGFSFVPLK